MNDNLLALQAKSGNHEALETLVNKHYQSVYRYFVRKVGDEQLALDMTQDTFIRVTKNIHTYRPLANFTTYLFTIAHNLSVDYYRKKRLLLVDSSNYLENLAMDIQYQESVHASKIKQILDQLPDKQKECIILYYYHDMKYAQIAKILNIPLSTVKSRVRVGLTKCKQLWEEDQ